MDRCRPEKSSGRLGLNPGRHREKKISSQTLPNSPRVVNADWDLLIPSYGQIRAAGFERRNMRGVNSVFLRGTLRGEPEQVTSKSGKNYIRFEMALVTVRRLNGVDKEQRETVPVMAFGKLGEIVTKYVKPSDPLHVIGHIGSNEFKTDTGTIRHFVSLVAELAQLIPNGRKEDRSS